VNISYTAWSFGSVLKPTSAGLRKDQKSFKKMDEQTEDFFQGGETELGLQPDFLVAGNHNDGGGADAFYEDIGDVDYTEVSGTAAPDSAAGMDTMQFPPAVMVMDEEAVSEGAFASKKDVGLLGFDGDEHLPEGFMMNAQGDDMTLPDGNVTSPGLVDALPQSASGPKTSDEAPMSKWNKEFHEVLKTRKDEENSAKALAVESAQKELEEFQALREKRREGRMAKNRSDEQQKLEDMEADLENDNSWQRVNKMVELQQDTVEGARDKKRIIDVLIKLKNDEETAAALS